MIDGDEDGRAEDNADSGKDRFVSTNFTMFRIFKVPQHATEKDGLTESDDALLKDKDEEDGHKLGKEGANDCPCKVGLFRL